MVKFISYDGKYPNLCSGTLTSKIDGKEVQYKYILDSGGSCGFDSGWNEHVTQGAWSVNKNFLLSEHKALVGEIEDVVNANVRFGCCGGCL